MIWVRLQISNEFYEFARQRARDYAHPDTKDYLNAVLNMALLTAIDEFEQDGPLDLADGDDNGPLNPGRLDEDACCGVSQEPGADPDEDGALEDGIPF